MPFLMHAPYHVCSDHPYPMGIFITFITIGKGRRRAQHVAESQACKPPANVTAHKVLLNQ